MNDEELALMAILNDESRSDVRDLIRYISQKSQTDVQAILGDVIEQMKSDELSRQVDHNVTQILKEAVCKERFRDYVHTIEDYRLSGVEILDYWNSRYPAGLRGITNPPLLLYIRGNVFPGKSPVAIVGTRHSSRKGLEIAREYAESIAAKGRTIVSGLAIGVDTCAHEGALSVGGTTVAVLAGHIGYVYPERNAPLAKEILERGALVSEVTSNAFLHRGRFIERNRITSGISESVLVIESYKAGGTLHQARFAIDQNRPLYVVDQGEFATEDAGQGYRNLVKMGATPVHSPDEVL